MNRFLVAILGLMMAVSCENNKQIRQARIPSPIQAEGYPAHIHLRWNDNNGSTYHIYRADEAGKFKKCATVSDNEYMDFSINPSDQARSYTYRICPVVIS
jgi:hypothetical protein